jgi:hypothetical protein
MKETKAQNKGEKDMKEDPVFVELFQKLQIISFIWNFIYSRLTVSTKCGKNQLWRVLTLCRP